MKTVFVVTGWGKHEEEFISSIFENQDDAESWAVMMDIGDEYGYQYFVKEWEVKGV